jgi:uncharacterized protein (TIGR02145 family)
VKKYLLLKLFVLILFDLSFFASKAQTPQATSYQAIIRNNSGILVSNRLVSLRFSIRDSIASGQIVYREIHNPITTTQGMVNLNVGNGTPISGSFSAINWGSKRKFLQVELDVNGGTAFTDLGTQQLLSVPYALYANKAAKADTALYSANSMPAGNASGDMLFWNGTSWINLPAGGYGQLLAMCDGVPSWGGCPPKITTNTTTSVTYASATSGGTVTTDGGSAVSAKGVCWSTAVNPTVGLTTKTTDGSGSGSFTSAITGLTPNTTYYVRAYATNSIGTSYGTQQTFTTAALSLPTVTTNAITNLTNIAVTSGGNVTADGGATVFFRGVCWGLSPNPTVDLPTKTVDGSGSGSFTSNITGLTRNTTYYVRAYAVNGIGVSYGNEIIFTTAQYESVTDISGNSYPIVEICSQSWMGKNLNVSKYRNGDIIPQVSDSAEWSNLTTGAWCWYKNDSATYASTYGKLYNWYAVNDIRGLAPNGWHIPSGPEWANLSKCIDSNTDTTFSQNAPLSLKSGVALKEADTLNWKSPNFATNSSRFTALPGGGRNWIGRWIANKIFGIFWSTTSLTDPTLPNPESSIIYLLNNDSTMYQVRYGQKAGLSVRCIKGDPPTVFLPTITTTPISSLGFNSFSSGGSNITNGGAIVYAKGVIWSTSPNPTINLSTLTNEGTGTSPFTSNITNLESNTTYYIRAYATTSAGTGYGNEFTFTTSTCPPSNNTNISALAGSFITNEDFGGTLYGPYTTNVSSFTNTTATSGTITVENIYDFGWAPITFKLDWSDPANPTVTLDQQENIAGGSTVGLDDTYQVMVRAFEGEKGTYSVCNQTLQLKMQIGAKDANGAELWAPSLYIVNMTR